jgi:uncharacterized protein YndB with AHSA1/START domain
MSMKNETNEIRITRIYDAPVKTVWEAWTDPEQVAQWWGPRGFSLTTHSKDLRAGGHWHYTMHGPDGTDYPNKTRYLEVEEQSRLVYDHGGNDEREPLFRVHVLFSEVNGKTKMDMTMTLPTPQAADETRAFIKKAGGNATWDRLAEYLAKETADKEQFVINRTFDVPLDLMQEMWTNPEHLSQWLPPRGFNMEFLKIDIRSGGSAFYCMSDGKGMEMYGQVEYREIEPQRLVYTQQFCDKDGKTSRHPRAPLWPETMLTTVTLVAEGPEQTRVTVVWEVYGNATGAELQTFVNERGGMTQGWTGSFDKLEIYLSESVRGEKRANEH